MTLSAADVAWARAQFPALQQQIHGHPAIFFDGPGGTHVPQRVIDAMVQYLSYDNANTHGNFATSARTDVTIDGARAAMADLLGCDADEIVFGPNMTTLTFALARALGRDLGAGDEIVLTRLDHDANFSPWAALAERGVTIRTVDVDIEDCTLDMADLRRQITPRTRLVAVGYASNAVGTINPIAEIIRLAREAGALSFVDAVHYAPHGPIDVRALGCDFLACSPYKFFGPHAGTLYGRRELLASLPAYKVRPASDDAPDRWEPGTKNHEALAGVTEAVAYLAALGQRVAPHAADRRAVLMAAMTAVQAYERELSEHLVAGLLVMPGLTFYGISDAARFGERTCTVSIRLAGHTPAALARALGERGICVWDGNYYALNLAERLGTQSDGGMVRIGLVHYNTHDEIDRLLAQMRAIAAG